QRNETRDSSIKGRANKASEAHQLNLASGHDTEKLEKSIILLNTSAVDPKGGSATSSESGEERAYHQFLERVFQARNAYRKSSTDVHRQENHKKQIEVGQQAEEEEKTTGVREGFVELVEGVDVRHNLANEPGGSQVFDFIRQWMLGKNETK
ncbi:hypothetical protein CSUI_007454, partial [Cystoisospora suis]